jgi:N-carbamoyl-L-amino-acid hydrolase
MDELGRIGAVLGGGVSRPAFGPADAEGRGYVLAEMRDSGLEVTVDAASNILVRLRSQPGAVRPAVLMGSHLDTVVNGGRFDGAYGVIAALEAVQAIAESGLALERDVVAVAFANEEGALFPQPFWGSMALAGRLADLPADPRSHQGLPLREPLARVGGDLDALADAVWAPGSVAAYLELHVEQGPVLERSGSTIGVVTAITGRTVLTIEVRGSAGHAGTTPMAGRQDAMTAAAQIVTAVQHLSHRDGRCRVSTVGRLDAHPNSPNTIADRVRLTVDLRDADAVRLGDAEGRLHQEVARIASVAGIETSLIGQTRSAPVVTDAGLRAVISAGSDELGLTSETLVSGAGHDAQIVAGIAPMAMIFVPSIGGVSHVPQEFSRPADLIAGARVLARTAAQLAAAPHGAGGVAQSPLGFDRQ